MKKTILLFAIAALGFSTMAHATLINRGTDTLGNRLIYDDYLNITWYDYTKSNDTWQNQVDWASNLSVTFGSQTFDDWRLPSTEDGQYVWNYSTGTADFNIIRSEMGHLYYTDLGNLGYNWGFYTGPFQHLLSHVYWSGTDFSLDTRYAWNFNVADGNQHVDFKHLDLNALAVRPGDVAAQTNPIPEPGTWMLLGSGLIGLAVFRRIDEKKGPGSEVSPQNSVAFQ